MADSSDVGASSSRSAEARIGKRSRRRSIAPRTRPSISSGGRGRNDRGAAGQPQDHPGRDPGGIGIASAPTGSKHIFWREAFQPAFRPRGRP
jgi:hypothetical protein